MGDKVIPFLITRTARSDASKKKRERVLKSTATWLLRYLCEKQIMKILTRQYLLDCVKTGMRPMGVALESHRVSDQEFIDCLLQSEYTSELQHGFKVVARLCEAGVTKDGPLYYITIEAHVEVSGSVYDTDHTPDPSVS